VALTFDYVLLGHGQELFPKVSVHTQH
jgi:hypothetical protein